MIGDAFTTAFESISGMPSHTEAVSDTAASKFCASSSHHFRNASRSSGSIASNFFFVIVGVADFLAIERLRSIFEQYATPSFESQTG